MYFEYTHPPQLLPLIPFHTVLSYCCLIFFPISSSLGCSPSPGSQAYLGMWSAYQDSLSLSQQLPNANSSSARNWIPCPPSPLSTGILS